MDGERRKFLAIGAKLGRVSAAEQSGEDDGGGECGVVEEGGEERGLPNTGCAFEEERGVCVEEHEGRGIE